MRKIAIFVEGQTELLFVYDFLLKWHDYQVSIKCLSLFKKENNLPIWRDFDNTSAQFQVRLVSVGMDENVIVRILEEEKGLYDQGYELIIGLRDMYSEQYLKNVKNKPVDSTLTEKIRQATITTIQTRAKRPDAIKFCFAIMEIEAWWLGIPTLWTDLKDTIRKQFGDAFADPESVFHPAVLIKNIRQSQQKDYKKHNTEVESIVRKISREDYAELHDSQRCPSFCEFVGYIQPQLN